MNNGHSLPVQSVCSYLLFSQFYPEDEEFELSLLAPHLDTRLKYSQYVQGATRSGMNTRTKSVQQGILGSSEFLRMSHPFSLLALQ